MKLNKRGFLVSTMMYMVLILALNIMILILLILSSRGKILNNLKEKVQNEINDNTNLSHYICFGNYASYKVGDLYNCDLSNTENEDFYIININSDSIDFVMKDSITFNKGNYQGAKINMSNKSPYISDNDYAINGVYNPITALKVLKQITDNWFYIPLRKDSIKNGDLVIDYNNYRARLLSFADVSPYVVSESLRIDFIKDTMTSSIYNGNNIYSIENNKIVLNKKTNDNYSIVPVITIPLDKIKNKIDKS